LLVLGFLLVADNVFSSLAGLQFMWQLMPETDGLPHHLVHVPLRDSPLSDCGGLCGDLNIQIELEDSVCLLFAAYHSKMRYMIEYYNAWSNLCYSVLYSMIHCAGCILGFVCCERSRNWP
jgi:hypothetical protein